MFVLKKKNTFILRRYLLFLGMSTQLKALRDDNDLSLKRIQKLEADLEDLRMKNNQLSDDLLKKAGKFVCIDSMI